MNDEPPNQELLNDCLADLAPPAFRDELLNGMLREARQRGVRRRNRQVAVAALAAVLAFAAVFHPQNHERVVAKANPIVVHSAPLGGTMLARTEAGNFGVVASSDSGLGFVEPADHAFESIGETQLIALLGGRPAVLLRPRDAEAELVFVHPADRDGFAVR